MKRASLVVGLVAAGAIVMFAAAAAPRAAGPVATAGDPVKGQAAYVAQKCNVCHKIGAAGGKIGPDLTAVGAKRDAAWLAKYLPNPTPIDPKNPPKMKMKATTSKGAELDDLIAYLLTLKGKK